MNSDRRNRMLHDKVMDPYRPREHLAEPSVCPECGVFYRAGRWQWGSAPDGATKVLCPACQRTADRQPAGQLVLDGTFVQNHKDELLNLARHTEQAERLTHPLNRIMAIVEHGGQVDILTTDVHLPHRIGAALRNAYDGILEPAELEPGTVLRVTWIRD